MPFSPDYPVTTERLLLRPITPDDVDAMHAYQSRPDSVRYVPYEPRTREQVAEVIASGRYAATMAEAPGHAHMAVVLRSTGELIGDLVLMWHSEQHRAGEVGYIFNPAHAGHGYATEATRALVGLGFAQLGLHRIVARLDARNAASAAVARRLGMRQEAHLRESEWFKGEWTDELIFAVLASEWPVSPAPG